MVADGGKGKIVALAWAWLTRVLLPFVAGWAIGLVMAEVLPGRVVAVLAAAIVANLLVVSPWLRARRRRRKEAGHG